MFLLIFLVFLSNQVKKLVFKRIGKKNTANCCFIEIILYFVSSLPIFGAEDNSNGGDFTQFCRGRSKPLYGAPDFKFHGFRQSLRQIKGN